MLNEYYLTPTMSELISAITKFISVSPALNDALTENFERITFSKKERFIKEGQISIPLGYISEGILRCFFNRDGEDITTEFFLPHFFLTDFSSFMSRKPATRNFECLEDAVIYTISQDKLFKLAAQFPELNDWGGRMAQQLFQQSLQNQESLKALSPEERYLHMISTTPELIQRVPLGCIASYLGITQVHLSRIRKNLR